MLLIKPHKAADAVLEKLKFPAIVSCKIDGVRGCFLNSRLTARTLKTFRNNRLTEALSHPDLQGFDGELALGEPTNPSLCRTTTSYVNSFSQNTNSGLPDWYIFDWVTPEIKNMPYNTRIALAKQYITNLKLKDPERFGFLKHLPEEVLCTNTEEVEAAHNRFVLMGYEGTVVRWVNAPHKDGRSTVNQSWFMRIKDLKSEEATIIDIVEAQENLNFAQRNALGLTERSTHKGNKIGKGMVGALIIQLTDGSIEQIGPGHMTHEERYKYWEQPKDIIGRICTFKSMAYGEHKKLRQARFVEFRDEDL